MHNLTNSDYKLFCSLAKVGQNSLRRTLRSFLYSKYEKVHVTEDYLYAEGDIPVAICAHMDTVFKAPPKDIYYDREQNVIWSPTGLGADDRAGIFSIIKILNDGFKPTVLFLSDEERGALGAEQLVKDFIVPNNEINFVIELDRRGTNDCVFYDCCNEDFVNFIERFGFTESFGTFSDISEICPGWGVAGVNLSIGYEDEHTTSEILRVNPMLDTIRKVEKILRQKELPFFKYVHNPSAFYSSLYSYNLDDDLTGWYNHYGSDYYICDYCGIPLHDYELIPAKDPEGKIKYYCPDCCADAVEWCYGCGESFTKGVLNSHGFCPSCAKKYDGKKKGKKK